MTKRVPPPKVGKDSKGFFLLVNKKRLRIGQYYGVNKINKIDFSGYKLEDVNGKITYYKVK